MAPSPQKVNVDDRIYFAGFGVDPYVYAVEKAPGALSQTITFEVNDMDTEALGHEWLLKKGYTNCWGIGRHVLGSQLFDYWFDSSGNILEHYCDGDLVNENTPATRSPEAPDSLHIWGPNVPLGFVTGRIEDAGKPILPPVA
ncbi:glyoxalase [Colletotrichum orchidophilum]|uniref:Glyoxalase n=1 Tax=Colletotrichum orchidophilum TaxID=1209926 RepID=A0A1G4B120_9PEZI|nr:glyoxalase [Colletotrichum orchidophilum]OHE95129.1 glyoxalase [Colletotrichum orchidophilum]